MVNLIRNENMKLYRRWRTWIMAALMIGAVLIGSFVDWHYDNKDAGADDWKTQITQEKQHWKEMIADPKTEEGSKNYAKDQLAIGEYRLAHDIRPESDTMWSGINGSAQLIMLITLFTVIVAGDSLAGEFSTGTIKLLLIRPASRLKILLSKYISMILFGLLLLIVLFVVSLLTNGLLYHFKQLDLPLVSVDSAGNAIELSMLGNLWKSYMLNGVSTILFVTLAFMISSAFRSSAMAIGISIFALFAGAIIMELTQPYAWSKYMLFANLDLSQYLNGRPYQDGMTMTFSILVLAAYFILFNFVSWFFFTRRDVAA
ncbi:ABC transporter permease [Paenibacillus sacheonensis]|uniref:ABC transporter permease subunit n=1 Tax=Paenibacillus sacheonensis TaxID=742054 RepID=A0A7X5BY67_9BACL|nr:ABC transporter permease [Paenibacillus sacheonensis]MBM7564829.1 ABC-2 type transport system permease protein [Paenibacillus sacheonensis]NBC69377.1 ABC transporter permease subunit [Paenibacillus sacheonensis]